MSSSCNFISLTFSQLSIVPFSFTRLFNRKRPIALLRKEFSYSLLVRHGSERELATIYSILDTNFSCEYFLTKLSLMIDMPTNFQSKAGFYFVVSDLSWSLCAVKILQTTHRDCEI